MLVTELTEEQNKYPDLTEEQLEQLSMESNFHWKINAEMLGYQQGMDIDEFIEEKTCRKINTFKKGKQMVFFLLETASAPDQYPMGVEGDYILTQEYELSNKEWRQQQNFQYDEKRKIISCQKLPENLTGSFRLVYGKYIQLQKSESIILNKGLDDEYKESCGHITENLKDIATKTKELEFISKNERLQPINNHLKKTDGQSKIINSKSQNLSIKNADNQRRTNSGKYRITHKN